MNSPTEKLISRYQFVSYNQPQDKGVFQYELKELVFLQLTKLIIGCRCVQVEEALNWPGSPDAEFLHKNKSSLSELIEGRQALSRITIGCLPLGSLQMPPWIASENVAKRGIPDTLGLLGPDIANRGPKFVQSLYQKRVEEPEPILQ